MFFYSMASISLPHNLIQHEDLHHHGPKIENHFEAQKIFNLQNKMKFGESCVFNSSF